MGVYIKGMEMPYGFAERGFVIRGDGRVRTFAGAVIDYATAVHVPPHGRLIDADALIATHEQVCSRSMKFNLDLAPTVIPASEVAPDINATHKTMEETPEIQHVGYDDAQLGREK